METPFRAERLDARFRDRAPRAVKIEGKPGEYLACEDIAPAPLAAFFSAGVPAAEMPEFMKRALLLGAYRGKDFIFVGKVGTSFSQQTLADLAKTFQPHIRSSPPFVDPPREKNVTWLEPRLVAQIAFQEWTADQKLRQPVFLGLRDEKSQTSRSCRNED